MSIRTKTTAPSQLIGYETDYYGARTNYYAGMNYSTQTTDSKGHWGWQKTDRDHGGDFVTYGQFWTREPTPNLNIYRGLGQWWYHGQFVANGSVPAIPTGDGQSWGPEAYRRMKPTRPLFSGLNSAYELREIPAMIRSVRNRFAESGLHRVRNLRKFRKSVGDSWLEGAFGWAPLFNDICNLVETQRQVHKRIEWLLRNNGKPVRTQCKLVDDRTVVTENEWVNDWGSVNPLLVTQFYNGTPQVYDTLETSNKIWATARWRYWLPPQPKDVKYPTRLWLQLYGVDVPSPSVIWNALPWTWLIDWFVGVGTILQNLEAGVADRLAADYIYVMRHQENIRYRTMRFRPRGSSNYVTARVTMTGFRKTRHHGYPFGWTVPGGLSPMQLGIMGALGLSRL